MLGNILVSSNLETYQSSTLSDMSCPRQWKFLSIQMRTCVKPFFLLKSWHGARKLCQDAGGDIVGISDFNKFTHVYGNFFLNYSNNGIAL